MLVSDIDTYEEGAYLVNPDDRDMPQHGLGGLGGLKSILGTVATVGASVVAGGMMAKYTGVPMSAVPGAVPQYVVQGTGEIRSPQFVSGPTTGNVTTYPQQYDAYNQALMQQQAGWSFSAFIQQNPMLVWGGGGILALVVLYLMMRR